MIAIIFSPKKNKSQAEYFVVSNCTPITMMGQTQAVYLQHTYIGVGIESMPW